MSILAVIPARLGATRLPGKPLRLLGGAPLIVRVWERVTALGFADSVVVATDAASVVEACRAAGATAVLTRVEHASGTDRVAEVARMPAYAHHDIIVNVQGDEPGVPREAILGAASLVSGPDADIGTAAVHAPATALSDPNVVKVVVSDAGRALYFSRAPIPFLRDRDDPQARADQLRLVRRHLGIYAYRRSALESLVALPPHPLERVEQLEQLRALAAGLRIAVVTLTEAAAGDAGGIDTEADLELANARWQEPITR